MWTNINTLEIAAEIKPGCIIAIDPDRLSKACVVTDVTIQSVRAIGTGKGKVIVMNKKEIISGKWWIEQHLLA